MDWGLLERFGVAGLIAVPFFLILKWVLEQFKIELVENRKERKEYLEALSKLNQCSEEHNARAKEFQTNVQKEHNEMIKSLGRINGYKQE
jgi:predicted nuclease with TOPRIM domain